MSELEAVPVPARLQEHNGEEQMVSLGEERHPFLKWTQWGTRLPEQLVFQPPLAL